MPARPKSLKFHAIAIGCICVVIIVMYFIMKPAEVTYIDPNRPTGERYIRINDATWGLNCNTEINRLRAGGTTKTGKGDKERPLEPVLPNNVLFAVTEMCNDRMTCDIIASNDTLDLDPLGPCYKELTVGWRCFSTDRKWSRQVTQGNTISIDCHDGVDQTKPPVAP